MEFLYVGKQMLLMLGTGFLAFVIAKGLFRSSLQLAALEEAALLTPAGLGILILLLFALGLLGFLSLAPVLGCVGLLLLLSAWRLKPRLRLGGLRTLRLCATPLKVLLLIAALVLLAPIALVPLTPPCHSDEIGCHLPCALHFVEQGAIVPDLHLRYPFFTLNVNLLYSFALLIGDDVTTHFMHFMLGFLAALNLYVLVRRLTDALTAFCAALPDVAHRPAACRLRLHRLGVGLLHLCRHGLPQPLQEQRRLAADSLRRPVARHRLGLQVPSLGIHTHNAGLGLLLFKELASHVAVHCRCVGGGPALVRL